MTRRVSLGVTAVHVDTLSTAATANPMLQSDTQSYSVMIAEDEEECRRKSGERCSDVVLAEEGDGELEEGGVAMSSILPHDDFDNDEQEPVLMEQFILTQP